MSNPRDDLIETYHDMSDDELVDRWVGGNLTEVAMEVARAEFFWRRIRPPEIELTEIVEQESGTEETVTFVTVARSFTPAELHILRARLEVDGIRSFVADDNTTQTNSLWSVAVGGARLLVTQELAEEAKQIIDLMKSGKFALRESDTGD